jgi:phosphate transport system permease protein
MNSLLTLDEQAEERYGRAVDRRRLIRTQVRRSLARRRLFGNVMVVLCVLAVLIALAPLVAMAAYTTARGIHALSVDFFTRVPTPVGIPGGGISNAIVGTCLIVVLGAAMSVPVGVMTAIFLIERRGRVSSAIRFAADVLSGVPSIAIGIFAYAVLVEPFVHYSALSGSFALAVLMLPIVIRSSEAAMLGVPRELWDAGLALGVRRSRVVRSVVLRGALPGLVTGNLLAVARAAGETAPLLFTALGSQLFTLSPTQPMASLPLVIFSDAFQPYPAAQQTAWGTAFVLLVLVLLLSIGARVIAARLSRNAR